jgi:hypothetical protein
VTLSEIGLEAVVGNTAALGWCCGLSLCVLLLRGLCFWPGVFLFRLNALLRLGAFLLWLCRFGSFFGFLGSRFVLRLFLLIVLFLGERRSDDSES